MVQFKKKSSNRCNTRRCGQIVGCVICLLLAVSGFIVFNIQKQAGLKAQQEALRAKQEEEILAKQRAQMEEQQQRLQEEQERQRKEEEELAGYKAAQEAIIQQRLVAKRKERQDQYQAFRQQLIQAEEKIASIAKLVDGEEAQLELASGKLPETLSGDDNDLGLIEKAKNAVENAERKLKELEEVMA